MDLLSEPLNYPLEAAFDKTKIFYQNHELKFHFQAICWLEDMKIAISPLIKFHISSQWMKKCILFHFMFKGRQTLTGTRNTQYYSLYLIKENLKEKLENLGQTYYFILYFSDVSGHSTVGIWNKVWINYHFWYLVTLDRLS